MSGSVSVHKHAEITLASVIIAYLSHLLSHLARAPACRQRLQKKTSLCPILGGYMAPKSVCISL